MSKENEQKTNSQDNTKVAAATTAAPTGIQAGPVDFTNPAAIASELAAKGTETAAPKAKTKKDPKPRVIKVTYVAAHDMKAGESVTFDFEVPKSMNTRGIVAGIPVVEMTDDQLKIEYRNANSVFYKTKKAGHDASKAEARLNSVKAEMEKRGIQPTARASAPIDAASVASMIQSGSIKIDDIQKYLDALATSKPAEAAK